MRFRWRQVVSILFAAFVASTAPLLVLGAPAVAEERVAEASTTLAVQRTSLPVPLMRDETAMVLVGSALIALAAAVRRAA